MRWVALVVVLALVGSACGSDDNDSNEAGETAGSDVDLNGVLRVGQGMTIPGGIHLDPTKAQTVAELQYTQLVLGTLLRITGKGEVEPMMAKSFKLVDPQTVQFTIREGLKFTDGTLYDAQAVKDGLLRTRDQVAPQSRAVQNPSIAQIGDITVDGPLALTVKLKTPVGGAFITAMAGTAGAIVSPAQVRSAPNDIDTKAIGAGPYTVVTFSQTQVTLKKNPGYVDADKWRIAEIQWSDVAEAQSKQAGLRAGTLDVTMFNAPPDAKALNADPAFGSASAFTEQSYLNMLMCTGKPPFDSEKVRQAVNIGINRQEINELVYEGLGAPAYGLWPKGHVNYEPKLESMLKYDPDKAKRLIAESGVPSPTFDMYYPTTLPDVLRVLEVMQAQLAKIGVKMNIVTGDILTQFVEPQKPGARVAPGSRTGVDKYVSVFATGQRSALCGVSHQDIVDKLAPAASAAPGDPTVAKLFREADLTIVEHAYYPTVVFVPRVVSYSKARLGGTLDQDGNGYPLYDKIYVKKR